MDSLLPVIYVGGPAVDGRLRLPTDLVERAAGLARTAGVELRTAARDGAEAETVWPTVRWPGAATADFEVTLADERFARAIVESWEATRESGGDALPVLAQFVQAVVDAARGIMIELPSSRAQHARFRHTVYGLGLGAAARASAGHTGPAWTRVWRGALAVLPWTLTLELQVQPAKTSIEQAVTLLRCLDRADCTAVMADFHATLGARHWALVRGALQGSHDYRERRSHVLASPSVSLAQRATSRDPVRLLSASRRVWAVTRNEDLGAYVRALVSGAVPVEWNASGEGG